MACNKIGGLAEILIAQETLIDEVSESKPEQQTES